MKRQRSIEGLKLWRPDGLAYEVLHVRGVKASMPKLITDRYTFALFEQGAAQVVYRNDVIKVGAGALLLLEPGEPLGRVGEADDPRSIKMLFVHSAMVEKVIGSQQKQQGRYPIFAQPVVRDPGLIDSYIGLIRQLETATTRGERFTKLRRILSFVVNEFVVDVTAPPIQRHISQRMKRAQLHIKSRFTENLSLDYLASRMEMSKHRFNRIFSREIGMPPHAYLNQVRLWKAKSLLEKGMPIAGVAVETGFYDQAHMTRQFKKILGYTPGDVLRSHKKAP